ncbi:MAG: hypothetical protein HZA06_04990 [Nitrospirae bacterium]|nr:hypothetical protein [Nitrospirota bacterium]
MENHKYLGISLISASALTLEIFLTRFFSVAQWHHFAFMVVSIALLGYGASGSFLMIFPSILKKDTSRLLYFLSLLLAILILFSYTIANYLPFDMAKIAWDTNQLIYILVYYTLLSIPFFIAGMIISITISLSPKDVNMIYFFDLVGASIGCLLPLMIFPLFGGIGPLLISAIFALISSLFFLPSPKRGEGRPALSKTEGVMGGGISLLFLSLIIYFIITDPKFLQINMSQFKGLNVALKFPEAKHIDTKWNIFSRIDAFESPLVRFAPGLSLKYQKSLPHQIGITIDGDSMTAITKLKGDIAELDFIPYLPSSLPFYIDQNENNPPSPPFIRGGMGGFSGKNVLILEPAGGLDILTALYFKSKQITGVEINPLIHEIIKNDFKDFSGMIYEKENVKIEIGEGRGYLKKTGKKFDIILFPVLSSMPASSGDFFGLAENYQFTEEAVITYIEHLNNGGILSITRYLLPPPREELRLISVIHSALKRIGINKPERHIAVIRTWGTITIIVKRSELSDADISKIKEFSKERLFDIVYYHGVKKDEVNIYNRFKEPIYYNLVSQIMDDEKRASLYKNYSFDITPVTDDRPFFFHIFKWDKIREVYKSVGGKWQIFVEGGYLLPIIFIQALAASAVFIVLPLFVLQGKRLFAQKNETIKYLGYFFFIGIAFMFVEISLIQKLILFLDHPVYAVSAVLFSILVFSGIGSFISKSYVSSKSLFKIIAAIAILLVLITLVISSIINFFLGWGLFLRGIITLAILCPIAILMGMPFPIGMRMLGEKGKEIIPWAWCVNGVASVISSILAIIIALSVGFNVVLLIAALMYLFGGRLVKSP